MRQDELVETPGDVEDAAGRHRAAGLQEGTAVPLHAVVAVLRRHLVLVLAAATAGALLAAGHVLLAERVYRATSRTLLTAVQTGESGTPSQGVQFLQARIASYPSVATSQGVLEPVLRELRLDVDAAALRSRVEVVVPEGTTVVEISASAEQPERAAAIADAVAVRFSRAVEELERPVDGGPSPVRASTLQDAVVPRGPVSPRPAVEVPLGLLAGLFAGTALAFGLEALGAGAARGGRGRFARAQE